MASGQHRGGLAHSPGVLLGSCAGAWAPPRGPRVCAPQPEGVQPGGKEDGRGWLSAPRSCVGSGSVC